MKRKTVLITASWIAVFMMVFSAAASGESGAGILDLFLPPADTAIPSAAVTETPAPNAFRFRDGIRWGMNTQQVQALEPEKMTERTMQNWSVMLTDSKVPVSRFSADLVFIFRDDQLMMASYEFQKGSSDDFLYLRGALVSIYGEKKDADPLKIKALMDAINPNRYKTDLIKQACGWSTADGTTIFLYYYSADSYAVTYVGPELATRIYQTNGL